MTWIPMWFSAFLGKAAALEDKTHPDWIPNQNLEYLSIAQQSTSASFRFERSIKRAKIETGSLLNTIKISMYVNFFFKVCTDEGTENPVEDFAETDHTTQNISAKEIHENCLSESVQTDLTREYILCRILDDLNFCNSKIYTLQAKLEIVDLNEDCFKNDDMLLFYVNNFPINLFPK